MWLSENVVLPEFVFCSRPVPSKYFVIRPLIDSGKLCDLLIFSRTIHCYQQQLLVRRYDSE